MKENGIIGLGRMGKGIAFRLLDAGFRVVCWDIDSRAADEVVKKGGFKATSLEDLIRELRSSPKTIWVMVPTGTATEESIANLSDLLGRDDIIIDGGNSDFRDSIRRQSMLDRKGISFIDTGTSGGIAGADKGYCMMVGGKRSVFEYLRPVFDALCSSEGYEHMGGPGSGHYVKMVHNAIEYGMMQSIAEGFDLLANGSFEDLNLKDIAHVWNHESIIKSGLMDIAQKALMEDPLLQDIEPYVEDSGEVMWAAREALEKSVPFVANTYALYSRYASRQDDSLSYRMLAALRNQFGGHSVHRRKP